MMMGFGFPPPGLVGHVVQHMVECRAHAVIVLPDEHEHWFPRISRATVCAPVLPKAASLGHPHHQDGVRDYGYVCHGMHLVEVGFPSGGQKLTARSGGVTCAADGGGRRVYFQIPVRKDVTKFLPSGCSKEEHRLPRNLRVAAVVEYRKAAEYMQWALVQGQGSCFRASWKAGRRGNRC